MMMWWVCSVRFSSCGSVSGIVRGSLKISGWDGAGDSSCIVAVTASGSSVCSSVSSASDALSLLPVRYNKQK